MKDIDQKYKTELGDKLGRFREEPPEGMFERIEESLMASGVASSSESAPQTAPVVPLWRRPWLKGVAATLAAASVAIGLMVGLGDEVEQMVQQQTPSIMAVAESPIVNAEEVTAIDEPEVLVAEVITPIQESVAAGKGELVAMVALAQTESEPQLAESTAEKEQTTANTKTRKKREKVSLTSEKRERRSREELEQYWRSVIEEEPWDRGVEHPVQIALYTANMGLNRGDVQMDNLAHSQMLVQEQHQLGGGSYLGPMMSLQRRTANLEHSMPVTLGVTVSYSLTDWLSVDSGLLYTSLSSRGESEGAVSSYVCSRSMDYLGIPLALSVYFAEFDRLSLYGRLGLTGELCVSSKDKFYIDGNFNSDEQLSNQGALSLSFDAAAGVTYSLVGGLGLFGEVGCSYWNAPENYPENYRTLHPLSLTTRLGVRFTFN